ncbi:TPA: EVE domain-containing protein [Candidatus Poribacteria bacterium]|nr:EVE domain-containing protein [Candidatus Poribacteria bacterium]
MIFRLDKSNYNLYRVQRNRLFEIEWKEDHFQKLLFKNLEKVFQDEELLLIMQSRKWQEEPDLMAIDNNGDLYIFELKAWESQEYNLLQALRYGQIYGQYSYESLNELFKKFFPESQNLLEVLNNKFGTSLTTDKINNKQHFIVITNGLDFKTRQAILYWQQQGIDIRSWVYRLYKLSEDNILIEFDTFRITEDPFEDIEEGFYILNTNYSNDPSDDKDMIDNQKAAAYFDPWKRDIEKLKKGDKVFLYRSGEGIVAMGIASGKLEKKPWHGEDKHKDEEYCMKLDKFKILKDPLSASDIKKITGVNYRFMPTMFAVDKDSGDKLWGYLSKNRI